MEFIIDEKEMDMKGSIDHHWDDLHWMKLVQVQEAADDIFQDGYFMAVRSSEFNPLVAELEMLNLARQILGEGNVEETVDIKKLQVRTFTPEMNKEEMDLSLIHMYIDEAAVVLPAKIKPPDVAITKQVPVKTLMFTKAADSAGRRLRDITPIQMDLGCLAEHMNKSDSKIDSYTEGVFRTGQLAATLQIVILSDTPAGMIPIKRHKIGLLEEGGFHDGVLSFYKTFRRDAPVKPEEFLSIWFLDMCRFFKDYGAPILVSVEKVPRKSTPLMFLERLFKPAAKRLHGNDMNKKLVSSGPQQEGPSPFNKFLQYLGVSQDDGPFHEDIALDSAMQNINKKISFLFEQMVTKLKMWNSQDDLKNKYAQVGSDPERRNAVLARAQRENDLKTRASLQPLFADLIKIQEEHQKEHPDQPWEHGELFWTAQSKPTEPGILHVALAMEDLGVFRKKGRLRWERRDQLRVRFPVLLEMPRALLSQENNTLEPLPPRIPIETQFGKGKLEIAVVEARRLKIPDLAKPSQAFAGEPLPALPTLQQRLHLNEVREKIGELLPDVTGTTSKAQRGSSSIKADFPTSHRPFIKLQLLDRKATDWESRCPRGHVLCLSYEAEAYWECQFRS